MPKAAVLYRVFVEVKLGCAHASHQHDVGYVKCVEVPRRRRQNSPAGNGDDDFSHNQLHGLSSTMSLAGKYRLVPSTAHPTPRGCISRPDSISGKSYPLKHNNHSLTLLSSASSRNVGLYAASSGRSHSQGEGSTLGLLPSLHLVLPNIENIINRQIRPKQLLKRLDADKASQLLLRWSVVPALLLALQPLAAPSQVGPGPMWQVRRLSSLSVSHVVQCLPRGASHTLCCAVLPCRAPCGTCSASQCCWVSSSPVSQQLLWPLQRQLREGPWLW